MKKTMKTLLVLLLSCTFLFAQGTQEQSTAKAPVKGDKVEWWDHFLPLAELHKTLWAQSEKETGNILSMIQPSSLKH